MHRAAACATIAPWWSEDAIAVAIVRRGRVLRLVIAGVIDLLGRVIAGKRFASGVGTEHRIMNAPRIHERHVAGSLPGAGLSSEAMGGGQGV